MDYNNKFKKFFRLIKRKKKINSDVDSEQKLQKAVRQNGSDLIDLNQTDVNKVTNNNPSVQDISKENSSTLKHNFKEIEESELPETPPSLNLLPLIFMKKFKFLPFNDSDEYLFVAMVEPYDFNTREVIQKTYGKPLKVYIASEELVIGFLYKWYEAEADMSAGEDEGYGLSQEDHLWDDPEQLKDMASEAPVIRLVNHLINNAVDVGASDIHIEPRKNNVQVRYRIDGVLHDQESISLKLRAAITSRVKLMAKMDIAERRLPQDGRIKLNMGKSEVDIRVSAIPVHFGESLVLRILHKENVQLDLDSMGFSKSFLTRFRKIISQPYGMFLVTGPTGSGKTTTLYGALNAINSSDKKIITVEDPVEYQLDGVNQVQVQSSIGLTFANTLRSFLRHDPDVMLIGEIRDGETADISVQAALTGHMVFSTLHTNDAAGALTRLEDMGIERFMISSSLVGVMAQRLVRRVCEKCAQDVEVTDKQREFFSLDLEISQEKILPFFRRGVGCEHCAGTGYKGRLGIHELLVIDDDIQALIVKGADRNKIYQQAVKNKMIPLRIDGIEKVNQGLTTYEEILRVTRG